MGAAFYSEYLNNSPKLAFFQHRGIYSTVFQAEVLSISEVAKNPLLETNAQSIAVLVDSQATIKSLIKCLVTSITELNCITNLNQLGKQNHVSIACFHRWAQLTQK